MILLAEARQTSLSEASRELYIRQLKTYDLRDVENAIHEMATEPREPFQSAFPDLGTILQRVMRVRDGRTARGKHQACGKCFDGFLIFNYDDDTPYHRVRDNGRDTYAVKCACLEAVQGAADRKTVAAGA